MSTLLISQDGNVLDKLSQKNAGSSMQLEFHLVKPHPEGIISHYLRRTLLPDERHGVYEYDIQDLLSYSMPGVTTAYAWSHKTQNWKRPWKLIEPIAQLGRVRA